MFITSQEPLWIRNQDVLGSSGSEEVVASWTLGQNSDHLNGRAVWFTCSHRRLHFLGLFRGYGSWLFPEQDEWVSDVRVCVCEAKTYSIIFYNLISSCKDNLSLPPHAPEHRQW